MPSRSPVKPPGPTPTAIRSTSSQPAPAAASASSISTSRRAAWFGRSPGAGSSRRSTAGPPGAQTATAVAAVAVSKPRITRPRPSASSPPACASRTRAATRSSGHAPGPCSGHSTNAIASGAKNGSSSPGSSSPIPASRYRSRCETGPSPPSKAWPTTNVGLVTGPSTPSARSAPRTNVVFPAPSSPETSTTSPGAAGRASRAPSRSVWSGPVVTTAVSLGAMSTTAR